jgi:hypothetical protein
MSVTVINGYRDTAWPHFENVFYENFNPDDWDYMIIGMDEVEVRDMASRLTVCDNHVKQIGFMWVAVTYHS